MKIQYLGHAGFMISSERTVIVDPFITGNPNPGAILDDLQTADIILVTHAHPDHLGDARLIAKKTGAAFVSVHELASTDELEGIGMNFGGTIEERGIPITMVKAEHSSGPGDAAGFVWKQDGRTLYHMGDTGLFSDMKLIGQLYQPDIVFVPIGDRYTMGPKEAAMAVEWVGAQTVFPMHWGTFPFLVQSTDGFEEEVRARCEARVVPLKPSESKVL
ncbi:MAG: metal-dependent hydrolase [Desulfobacteraceae bacterium]|jgi:L-ascorbate metabolism protein UlaG (beta-lactamase superfamily)